MRSQGSGGESGEPGLSLVLVGAMVVGGWREEDGGGGIEAAGCAKLGLTHNLFNLKNCHTDRYY